jgi:two-component system NtrC family sensor kinase
MADAHQIQQVILNLMVNAEQAMSEANGKGRLHVQTFAEDGNIHIVVSDDGPGIAQKNLHKVFDPFFTTKPVGKGTGLGLSICQGIVAEHGGRIDLKSSPEGTTFDVIFPIDHRTEAAPKQSETVAEVIPIRKKNILLVDDEPHILELAEDLFESGNYTVQTAASGKAALEMIRNQDFDLIITDLMMPEVSGEQVYTEVQSMPASKPKKVLFITGDLMNPETQHYLEHCGVPWVGKPFDIASFKRKVQSVLAA